MEEIAGPPGWVLRWPYQARKIDRYLLLGTRLVWIVEPRRRTVTVYETNKPPVVFREYGELDGGDVLPGFP